MRNNRKHHHSQGFEHFQKRFRTIFNQALSLLRFNITFKLTLGYTFHIVSLLVFILGLSYLGIAFFGIQSMREKLDVQSQVVESLIQLDDSAGHQSLLVYLESEGLKLYVESSIQELSEIGVIKLVDSLESFKSTEMISPKLLIDLNPLVVKKSVMTERLGQVSYALVFELKTYQDFRTAVLTLSGLGLAVITLASALEMSRMAKHHLSPIHVMTAQVKDISSNNLNVRLNVSGIRDELKDLAMTFNHMMAEIEGNYDREKQFVSDASHELRTPIAVVKGYANLLIRWGKDDPDVLDESLNAIAAEADNMQRLVEDLLFIARHEQNKMKVELEPILLSELIKEVAKESELIDQNHYYTVFVEPQVYISGSLEHFKQAVRIMIDNSIKYTPPGGDISLSLKATDQTAILVIKDNGIGISETDLPHVFDRFYRADKSRTRLSESASQGTGLGLSIAKVILDRHDAKVYIESVLNGGTEISILIPTVSILRQT